MRPGLFVIFWLALSAFMQGAAPDPAIGHWQGVMVREGASLPVSFDVERSGAALAVRFNSPTQRALGIPIRVVRVEGGQVHFELVGDATTFVFDGRIEGRALNGTFTEGPARGTFALTRTAPAPLPYREEQVRFRDGDTILAGSLLIPDGAGRAPAVLFLHGSGSENRNASRFLADYLARHGIAALIYDKRGVGESTGDWHEAGFETLADDGAAGLDFLAGRREIDPARLGIYGHSQGGMIAPLLASRSKRVSFVIGGAGSAVPLHQAEVNSIVNQIRAQGIEGEELAAARRFIARLVAILRTGEDWPGFEAETARVKSERWYPMLHVPAKDNWFWAYYRRIADYDSSLYWRKVKVPSLLIYGERDNLVPLGETIANADRALNAAGNQDYTILMLPRADHAFNIRPDAGRPFEWAHLAPGLPELLVAWIRQRTVPD